MSNKLNKRLRGHRPAVAKRVQRDAESIDAWFVLSKSSKKFGPFSAAGLVTFFEDRDSPSEPRVRRGGGEWISLANARSDHPDLEKAFKVHESGRAEAPLSSPKKPTWYVLEKGCKAQGPLSAKDLLALLAEKENRGITIRRGKKGDWRSLGHAAVEYPELALEETLGTITSEPERHCALLDDRILAFGSGDVAEFGKTEAAWHDEAETRRWSDYPELQDFAALGRATHSDSDGERKGAEALHELDRLTPKFHDFYFVHGWRIGLLAAQGNVDAARVALSDGVARSKRRSSLFSNFATAAWRSGNGLPESVHWWMVSATLQRESAYTTHDPFLYLSSVAEHLGDPPVASRLLELSDEITGRDMLRLAEEAQWRIRQAVEALPNRTTDAIRSALCDLVPDCGTACPHCGARHGPGKASVAICADFALALINDTLAQDPTCLRPAKKWWQFWRSNG